MPSSHLLTLGRRAAVASVLAAAGALTFSAGSTAAQSAHTAGTRACQTAGLVTWLDLPGDGAAGSIIYSLDFTNLSGHKCTLRGYPGVSAITLRGRQVGKAAVRDNSRKTKTITLKNGASAVAMLKVEEAGNFPPASCGPVTAAGMRVFPPNQKASRTIPFPFGVCSKGPSNMAIQVVEHD